MARIKSKWKLAIFSYLILVNVFTRSLPLKTPLLVTSDTAFRNVDMPQVDELLLNQVTEENVVTDDVVHRAEDANSTHFTEAYNITRNLLARNVRPGQDIRQYAVEIDINGNSFDGRLVIDVVLSTATREDPIVLQVEDLNVRSVMAGVFSEANAVGAGFNVDDGILEIEPSMVASSYIVIIEYSGSLTPAGEGLYRGVYGSVEYIGMNLYPTNARRVFPCMDDPTLASTISFTFNNVGNQIVSINSIKEDNTDNQYRALQGPPHLWSMIAHNFQATVVPLNNVFIYVRQGMTGQDAMASLAINNFFTNLNDWTNKPYFEIVMNQNDQMNIIAVPDVNREWYGLSTVGIWEPYLLMENSCSRKQRFTALFKMAEALARQWFGYVIYPENFRYDWVISGLATYAAYDILREFQELSINVESDYLDINTLFVTEVIQESLQWDSYNNVDLLEPNEDLFDENAIRDYLVGNQKYKSPAIMKMLRNMLGDASQDFIKLAAQALLNGRALQTVDTLNFIDAINSNWLQNGNAIVEDIGDFLEPYIKSSGYPLVSVSWSLNGVQLSLESFSFPPIAGNDPDGTAQPNTQYEIPLTYSLSSSPDFGDPKVFPSSMISGTWSLFRSLDDDDYVLFNVQGQGYYRVHYDGILWERMLEALNDPDRRSEIHPLNRATLLDDVMVLARGGRADYETALFTVLSWEHETQYAPWKTFIRNMNFLRKRLIALVSEDEDLDPDIYLRMIRRTMGTFEQEIGFSPDPSLTEPAMTSLTRGLVMDHACRSNYQPCIAAAVDWFYDPNAAEPTVNPNIPHDIRPAVYCTMVREGDNDVLQALNERLEIEPSMYERVVILESFGCSQDRDFINQLLIDTVATNSQFSPEERVRIFKAVAEASFDNAWLAFDFLRNRVIEIRNMYGGAQKLEEVIITMADNMADSGRANDFEQFVFSQLNNLEDSQLVAERVVRYALENAEWDRLYLEFVYEWINENGAPSLVVSFLLITVSCFIALFNH